PLTKRDIDLAPKGTDPKGVATMLATNITQLRREKRCGTLAFDPNQFPDSNKKDIDGGSNKRFDEADTKPIGYIEEGIDACLVRPNYIAFGHEAWRIWKNLPEVRTTILGTAGGNVTRERAAEFFEVQKVLVGASRGNTAKPGKTPNLARLWGKAVLMFYSDKTAPLTGGVTFAFTAQYGTRIAGTKEVERGLEGGIDVMSGEAVEEVICAPRAGYLIYNAVG
ncbi:MAG TPA: hypothetical protein VHO25_16725, partial [Polyangiaceae bacterium]|nr:hypothetical protein [Polyangiaceae bacterium]